MKKQQNTTAGPRIATTRAPRILSGDQLEVSVGGEGDQPPKRPLFHDDGATLKRPPNH